MSSAMMTIMLGRWSPDLMRLEIGALATAVVAAKEQRNERLETNATSIFTKRGLLASTEDPQLKAGGDLHTR